jgi:hypothetical protein
VTSLSPPCWRLVTRGGDRRLRTMPGTMKTPYGHPGVDRASTGQDTVSCDGDRGYVPEDMVSLRLGAMSSSIAFFGASPGQVVSGGDIMSVSMSSTSISGDMVSSRVGRKRLMAALFRYPPEAFGASARPTASAFTTVACLMNTFSVRTLCTSGSRSAQQSSTTTSL